MLEHHVLIDEARLAKRIEELAARLRSDLKEDRPVIVGLLTGSFIFVADLVRALARRGFDPEVEFLPVTHYGAEIESPGYVTVQADVSADISHRSVLLVDDILDSGLTLRQVAGRILDRRPEWFRTCVLLDKPSRRQVPFEADYVGFEVPDVWVIGFGLDAGGSGRGLPYVAELKR